MLGGHFSAPIDTGAGPVLGLDALLLELVKE
jgi:hypothetical protein